MAILENLIFDTGNVLIEVGGKMEILVGILNFFVGKLKRGVGFISRLTAGRLLILWSLQAHDRHIL